MPETALTIDGQRFIVSPLDLLDAAILDHWLQGYGLMQIEETINPDLPFDVRQQLLAAPVSQVKALGWANAETYEGVIGSDEGIARLAWQSVHRRQPHVTLQDINPLFFGEDKADNRTAFLAAFQRANTPEHPQEDAPRGPLHFSSLSSFLAWRDSQQN